MYTEHDDVPMGKKIYFASDFHLGAPNKEQSLIREKKIVRWLDSIMHDAYAIYLVGDIFDFWFEYRTVIPKGYVRFKAKLLECLEKGIKVVFFTGNHDMWMFGYFTSEFGIPVHRDPILLLSNDKRLLVGHGDGLGPGDRMYKVLKRIFRNRFCQWAFARLHPNLGIGVATAWSQQSRLSSGGEETFKGDDEWIYTWCKEQETTSHHDYYIFGHRHLPLDLEVSGHSRYINLGEWVTQFTYATFDGRDVSLLTFEE
ncbi:UDP-2,3-diacylglucosamine diphosphatase [Roseivirga sp. BDSF3-8]|uniref:UDP-2,3-diacylglucosamine diphosphatase n=1 Tax=Roseivirga sp. BDSF3-8 TaxID=3241598 RepID=UPI003532717D